jgi:hypothetical protein
MGESQNNEVEFNMGVALKGRPMCLFNNESQFSIKLHLRTICTTVSLRVADQVTEVVSTSN